MNEDLLNDLNDAMKRREKAQNAIIRWQEQLNDANEDIRELSARIAGVEDDDEEAEEEAPVQPEWAPSATWHNTQEPATQE